MIRAGWNLGPWLRIGRHEIGSGKVEISECDGREEIPLSPFLAPRGHWRTPTIDGGLCWSLWVNDNGRTVYYIRSRGPRGPVT